MMEPIIYETIKLEDMEIFETEPPLPFMGDYANEPIFQELKSFHPDPYIYSDQYNGENTSESNDEYSQSYQLPPIHYASDNGLDDSSYQLNGLDHDSPVPYHDSESDDPFNVYHHSEETKSVFDDIDDFVEPDTPPSLNGSTTSATITISTGSQASPHHNNNSNHSSSNNTSHHNVKSGSHHTSNRHGVTKSTHHIVTKKQARNKFPPAVPGVVRKADCPICHKHVRTSNMPRHMRTHAGVHRFRCKLCQATFIERYASQQHIYKHHPEAKVDQDLVEKIAPS